MMRSGRFFPIALAVVGLTFAFERQAHAYADPGSGLLLFQASASVVTGLLYVCNKRIRDFLARWKREK